jgi:hypothetical protein
MSTENHNTAGLAASTIRAAQQLESDSGAPMLAVARAAKPAKFEKKTFLGDDVGLMRCQWKTASREANNCG